MRELIICTNKGQIIREYPDRWQYENKNLAKLMKEPGEEIVAVIMSEKYEPKT